MWNKWIFQFFIFITNSYLFQIHYLNFSYFVFSIEESDDENEDEFSSIDVRDYIDQFPFENLVFEGGGIKGLSYLGAIKVQVR